MGKRSSATRSSVMAKQMSPRPWLAMKLIASGVTRSAAMVRSPSFSRSWSSTTMTILPARISSMAWATEMLGLAVMDPFDDTSDLLGYHVGLQIDMVRGAKLAEQGDTEGVRNEQNFERRNVDLVHGQAYAVDGDRAFAEEVRRDLGRGGDTQREGVALLARAFHAAGSVDVSADHMSAHGIAQA